MNTVEIKKELEIFFHLFIFLGIFIALAPILGVLPIGVISIILIFISIHLVLIYSKTILRFKSSDDLLAVMGFSCVILILSGLGIAQIVHDENALFWNFDNRYFATLAHTILKYGDLSKSLEYAGAGSMYHAGPSWIAASLSILAGINVNISLFLILPFVYAMSISLGLFYSVRNFSFSKSAAIFSVFSGLLLTQHLPLLFEIFHQFIFSNSSRLLLNPHNFLISVQTMQNSLLAMAIFFPSLFFMLTSNKINFNFILGSIGIISMYSVKPQFFTAAVLITTPVVFLKVLNFKTYISSLLLLFFGILFFGFIYLINDSGAVSRFGGVQLISSFDNAVLYRFTSNIYFIFPFFLMLALFIKIKNYTSVDIQLSMVMFGVIFLYLFNLITVFPVNDESISKASYFGLSLGVLDGDIDQNLLLGNLVGVILIFALSFKIIKKFLTSSIIDVRWLLIPSCAFLLILSSFRMYAAVHPIYYPMGSSAYEWSNERDLNNIFNTYQPDGLIIVNDLSDSAENYRRPLRALNITSLGPYEFYAANFIYFHYLNDDSIQRLQLINRFFGSEWTSWHTHFIHVTGIKYALISNRCDIFWGIDQDFIDVVAIKGRWTLLKFNVPAHSIPSTLDFDNYSPIIYPIKHSYGKSSCL